MNPLTIYLALVFMAVGVGIVALIVVRGAERVCPGCGDRVLLTDRICRACRYRFP
jgi:predicted amidophosphoribosyltransferase